jgi:hypothetical protein
MCEAATAVMALAKLSGVSELEAKEMVERQMSLRLAAMRNSKERHQLERKTRDLLDAAIKRTDAPPPRRIVIPDCA